MKVAILISLARQVEGELVFLNVLRCHTNPNKLREYLATANLPRTVVLQGNNCIVEYGVFEDIEVEQEDNEPAT